MKQSLVDFASVHADKTVEEIMAMIKKLPQPAKPIAVAQLKSILGKIKISPQYRKRVKKKARK